jgi:hypothetical protein
MKMTTKKSITDSDLTGTNIGNVTVVSLAVGDGYNSSLTMTGSRRTNPWYGTKIGGAPITTLSSYVSGSKLVAVGDWTNWTLTSDLRVWSSSTLTSSVPPGITEVLASGSTVITNQPFASLDGGKTFVPTNIVHYGWVQLKDPGFAKFKPLGSLEDWPVVDTTDDGVTWVATTASGMPQGWSYSLMARTGSQWIAIGGTGQWFNEYTFFSSSDLVNWSSFGTVLTGCSSSGTRWSSSRATRATCSTRRTVGRRGAPGAGARTGRSSR